MYHVSLGSAYAVPPEEGTDALNFCKKSADKLDDPNLGHNNHYADKLHVSQRQYLLHNLMGMGSLLRTILGTILNYHRTPMSSLKLIIVLGKPSIGSSSYELQSIPLNNPYNTPLHHPQCNPPLRL